MSPDGQFHVDLKEMMVLAYEEATHSPDPSTQNGAVLLDAEGTLIGRGCNNFPVGVDVKYWTGEKQDKYDRVVHAEVAAVLDAGKAGCATQGSVLVCPWAACASCAKHMAYAGVVALFRHKFADGSDHWRKECDVGDEIFEQARLRVIEIDTVPWDGELRRNGKVWTT